MTTTNKTTTVKTSDLTGAALDWAVAKCESLCLGEDIFGLKPIITAPVFTQRFKPSTDWSQGGPIIEREKISLECKHDGWWVASYQYNYSDEKEYLALADNPLVAAMRCYVASKLGNEVEIQQELI